MIRPETDEIFQIVTQLEPAGAQSVAAWIEESVPLDVTTLFLYQKAPYDKFPDPCTLVQRSPRNPFGFAEFVKNSLTLRARLNSSNLLLAHTHYSIMFAALMGLGRRDRPRTIAVHHWPEERYPGLARLTLPLARRLHLLDLEVYCSPAIAPPGGLVIPNPIPALTRSAGSDGDHPDILVVARHAPEKSLDTALRALALLPEERSATFVGGGPDTEELLDLAKTLGVSHRARFVGRVSNADVQRLMSEAECFLLPSLWEAMPMSLLEAVAASAKIVVSDIPAHTFIIDEGAAEPFTAGAPDSLAAAVERLSDPDVVKSLQLGRRRLTAKLDSKVIAAKWRDVLTCASSLPAGQGWADSASMDAPEGD